MYIFDVYVQIDLECGRAEDKVQLLNALAQPGHTQQLCNNSNMKHTNCWLRRIKLAKPIAEQTVIKGLEEGTYVRGRKG